MIRIFTDNKMNSLLINDNVSVTINSRDPSQVSTVLVNIFFMIKFTDITLKPIGISQLVIKTEVESFHECRDAASS